MLAAIRWAVPGRLLNSDRGPPRPFLRDLVDDPLGDEWVRDDRLLLRVYARAVFFIPAPVLGAECRHFFEDLLVDAADDVVVVTPHGDGRCRSAGQGEDIDRSPSPEMCEGFEIRSFFRGSSDAHHRYRTGSFDHLLAQAAKPARMFFPSPALASAFHPIEPHVSEPVHHECLL